MSSRACEICVSFWKWNYILCVKFNHSCDLASKVCKTSNTSYASIGKGESRRPWGNTEDAATDVTAAQQDEWGLRGQAGWPRSPCLATCIRWPPWARCWTSPGLCFPKCKTPIIILEGHMVFKLGYFEEWKGTLLIITPGQRELTKTVWKTGSVVILSG